MKIKLLFFINTLSGGGAEKVLVDIVNNLDKEKFDITLLTLVDDGIHKKNLSSDVHYKSIVKVKNGILKKIWQYFLNFVLPPKIIYNIFIKSDYDYEVAFLEGIPTKILSYSTNKNSKKFAWVHTNLFTNFAGHNKIFKNFDDYVACYKRYDKIFCVSEGVKDGFFKRFGIKNNTEVIFNPYDDEKIVELSDEGQCEISVDDIFKIVTVGRLCEQKGYERLIEIYNRLIKEKYHCHLYILGEGAKRLVLEKYINENNLQDSVTLLGFKKNPYKYIKACDLFVCSSFAEGFSTAVAESIILGVPVISTNVSGAKEILGNSEFGLVTENNAEALYTGLKELLSKKEKYDFYKIKAAERASYFKLENSIKNIENIFFGGK